MVREASSSAKPLTGDWQMVAWQLAFGPVARTDLQRRLNKPNRWLKSVSRAMKRSHILDAKDGQLWLTEKGAARLLASQPEENRHDS